METIVQTEYQDVYRVTDGVLLVVNKFERNSVYEPRLWQAPVKSYNKNTKELKILKSDFTPPYPWREFTYPIPKGTVIYQGTPVQIVSKENWKYEIKTTGSCFGGDGEKVLTMLTDIQFIIEHGIVRPDED